MEPYFVYIVRCTDGTLYTGTAKDPQARERAHNEGRGARYTSGRRPVTMVYAESCESRSLALKREHQVKRLTRAQKESLVERRIEVFQAVRSGNKD
jgi:putative endonuclease